MLKDIKDISKDMALFYRPVFTPPFLLRAQVVKLLLLLKQSLAVIEPATLTERCIKCWKRTSYLLKRMLGINSPT